MICLVFAFSAEGFFSTYNLLNVLRNVSMQGIIAFGMTMVIIAGEIDLSVGSAVAFSGCLTAYGTRLLIGSGMGPTAAIGLSVIAALMLAFAVGCATGYLRIKFQVPTFITTLATMTGLTGASYLITNGFPITPFPEWYNFIGGGYLFGIPFPAIIFLIIFVIISFLMDYTIFGRSVYAVGGNIESARLSGINVGLVKILVMGFVSLLAALSGVMQSAQIMSGTPATAKGWELDVISAVIIGGTSLLGGQGRIRGTIIGIIFLGILVNGMTLMNINEYWQYLVKGGLILTAVLVNRMTEK